MIRAVTVSLLALAVLSVSHWAAYLAGRSVAQAQAVATDQAIQAHTEVVTAKAETAATTADQKLAAAVATAAGVKGENDNARTEIDHLRGQLRTGVVRLSVATDSTCSAAAGPGAAAPSGEPVETPRAELVPEDAENLVSIGAEGNDAIRERNALIVLYNEARATLQQYKAEIDRLRGEQP
ncbi:lysis system i-spanin subunit Rz [Pigmentiphaga sp. CHJ604]|uniref:lysis system i-spanin subunit Rz n=1 Tax=Pigmentiphaga sp. CHJ604 TaxID=3081984 RepID=UPI0030D11F9B